MKTALTIIHDTYLKRSDNPDLQKKAWRGTIIPVLPPDLEAFPETRPSVLLAGESGDLGCALLWIVQAALVRPILERVNQQTDLIAGLKSLLASITESDCGALAHSEPHDKPVILTTDNDGLHLNGVKKYITAGNQADFILVSAREPGDEKVSQLLLLPMSVISPGKIKKLDLKALRTTNHGRLVLENKSIPGHCHLPLSASMIRKELKINGLVERCLILEAVLALMIYLNNRLARHMPRPPTDEAAIKALSVQQTGYTTAAISQVRNGQTVQPQWVDLTCVNTAIESICSASDDMNPAPDEDLIERVNDLRFIRSLWG